MVVCLAVMACEGHDPPPRLLDAASPDAARCSLSQTCNPIGQAGCSSLGDKCTWIRRDDGCDHIACVGAGALQLGAPCSFDQRQGTSSFDACIAGAVCSEGTCRRICNIGVDVECDAGEMCITATDVFAGLLGVCTR